MQSNPIDLFRQYYDEARADSPLAHPQAFCLSTIGSDGTPEARFVALKEILDEGFVFCSSADSAKGQEIAKNPAVALTFWWDNAEKQVRISGRAETVDDERSDRYFARRYRASQITSHASKQSAPIDDPADLKHLVQDFEDRYKDEAIPRPDNWKGYLVRPHRIEFLGFRSDRLHERTLFVRDDRGWLKSYLQP